MHSDDGREPAPEKELDQQSASEGGGAFTPPVVPPESEGSPPEPAAAPTEPEPARKASLGDLVIYHVSETDEPNTRHNNANELPAIVVAVFGPGYANLKLVTDGPTNTWKTSVPEGLGPGTWRFRD